MPRRTHSLLVCLAASLMLVSCSTSDDQPQPQPSTEDGPPADGLSGVLVAAGTGYILTYDLDSGSSWQQRLSYSAPWSTVTIVEQDRELLIANTSGSEPVVVTSYDLDTFGRNGAFEWPDSTYITTLHSLAATTDGDYLALVMEPLQNPYLEIVERSSGRVIYTGLNIATGATMAWTTDDRLVVPIDLSHEDNSDRSGAIAAFSLTEFEAATDESVDGDLITTFTRAEWDRTGVGGLALSADDSELVFDRAGDLWVVDLEPGSIPHQLTTGPARNSGAVYSPDGSHLALVSNGGLGLRETYAIDNLRGDPLFLDDGQDAGAEFLLERRTLVDNMVGWLP